MSSGVDRRGVGKGVARRIAEPLCIVGALTLHRPWAWALVFAGKDVENRSWRPNARVVGSRIAVHAGQRYDDAGARFIAEALEGADIRPPAHDVRCSAGVIVGTVRVVGWAHASGRHAGVSESVAVAMLRSPWFVGPYGWICTEAIGFREPVPCRGAQGLWRLPPAVEAEVLRQQSLMTQASTAKLRMAESPVSVDSYGGARRVGLGDERSRAARRQLWLPDVVRDPNSPVPGSWPVTRAGRKCRLSDASPSPRRAARARSEGA